MPLFRSRSARIPAVRNEGEWGPIVRFLDEIGVTPIPFGHVPPVIRELGGRLRIRVGDRTEYVEIGDWMYCPGPGRLLPCKDDLFELLFEEVPA